MPVALEAQAIDGSKRWLESLSLSEKLLKKSILRVRDAYASQVPLIMALFPSVVVVVEPVVMVVPPSLLSSSWLMHVDARWRNIQLVNVIVEKADYHVVCFFWY